MEQLSHNSDDDLLQAFQAGDVRAYEVIYDRYWQILFRFSRKRLLDDTIAKDVVQEVFTTLWIKNAEIQIKPPLAAYLYAITRNKILDLLKHSKVELKYLESLKYAIQLSESLPDSIYVQKELQDHIEREIKNLPEKMRTIFELSRKEYRSNQQIADELNITNKTVKNQLSNAVRILKNKLGDSFKIFLTFL